MARGLEYLHDAAAVSHWGISSTKVLLFRGFRAKIDDYDLFKQLRLGMKTVGNGRENVLTIPAPVFFGREREQEREGQTGK